MQFQIKSLTSNLSESRPSSWPTRHSVQGPAQRQRNQILTRSRVPALSVASVAAHPDRRNRMPRCSALLLVDRERPGRMNLQTATTIWRSGRGVCRFHVRISRVFTAEPNRANGAANRSPAICFVSSNSIRRESSPAQLDANSGVTNGRRPSWFLRHV